MTTSTFGVELEAVCPRTYSDRWSHEVLSDLRGIISSSLNKYHVPTEVSLFTDVSIPYSYDRWIVKFDASCGQEVTSTPLTWDTAWHLDVVAGAMWRAGWRASRNCGLHVHHLLPDITEDRLKNIWKHWAAFEPLIMAMVTPNRLGNQYSQLLLSYNMIGNFVGLCRNIDRNSLRYCIEEAGKYRTLNASHWWRTGRVEVRAHHGTLCAKDIKTWIMITQRFLEASKEGCSQEVLETIAGQSVKVQLQSLRTLLSMDSVDTPDDLITQATELIQRRSPKALEVSNDRLAGYAGSTF